MRLKPIQYFLLQKKVIWATAFEHFTSPTTPLFSDLKILKLRDLFQLKLLSFVYGCVNKISPSRFHPFFNLVQSVHQLGTRQTTKNDFFLTLKNTAQYGLRLVRCFGAKCWNDIPMDVKSCPLQSVSIVNSKLSSLKIFIIIDFRIPGDTKKRPAFEWLLAPEYINNDILQYLIK